MLFRSWLILIFVSGINLFFLFSISLVGIILLLYVVFYIPKFEYIKNRLLSFFDAETGTHNFQSDKALDSIMSGGFFGKGIGEGTLKNRYVDKEANNTARLVLVGSASLILLQAMIHIGVNIRLFPTTGMTLPFLSYGGSSIISVSILSGIILNLTKRKVLFSK